MHQSIAHRSTRSALGVLAALLATALAGRAAPASAQTVNFSLPVVATLYLDVTGSLAFNTTAVTAADFAAGYRQSSSQLTVVHRGNVAHRVQISTSAGTMAFAPLAGRSEPDPAKPVSDLRLSADGFASAVPLSTTAATLITQSTPTGTGSVLVDARINLDYVSTPPGTYSTTVVFTIVQN